MERSKRARRRKLRTTTLRNKNRLIRERILEIESGIDSQLHFRLSLQIIINLMILEEPPTKEISKRSKLTLEERIEIYRCKILQRLSVTQIAKRLKRSVSTISRELERNKPLLKNHGMDCYSMAKQAHDKAKHRKVIKRHKERLKNQETRNKVEELLKSGLTPELISERLLLEFGQTVSHESIYQWIYKKRPDLIELLPRGKKRYHPRTSKTKKRGKRPRPQPAAPKTSIDKRPKAVSRRTEFGHWEMDTIVSKQSKECLFVLQERVTRFFFVVKLKSCCSKLVQEAILRLLRPLGRQWVKSITCDNGPENSCHAEVSKELGIPIYFCHPYSASERGGVENRNGLLRRDFPKKTDFSLVTEEKLQAVRYKLINRPMKCLGYFSPEEIFYSTFKPILKLAA